MLVSQDLRWVEGVGFGVENSVGKMKIQPARRVVYIAGSGPEIGTVWFRSSTVLELSIHGAESAGQDSSVQRFNFVICFHRKTDLLKLD